MFMIWISILMMNIGECLITGKGLTDLITGRGLTEPKLKGLTMFMMMVLQAYCNCISFTTGRGLTEPK